jgi:hypothetical protein
MSSQVAGHGDLFIGSCAPCLGAQVTGILMGDASSVLVNGKKASLIQGIGIGL